MINDFNFQNRDSDTHMEITKADCHPPRMPRAELIRRTRQLK